MSVSVTVLCPSGHRVALKLNSNEPVLAVIDAVCQKRGLACDPGGSYVLKHHKRTLDPALSLRFANVPNNAQLELVEAAGGKAQSSSGVPSAESVAISLQLENGERKEGQFPSSENLGDLLLDMMGSLEDSDPSKQPILVYMRREVVGLDSLRSTTLRSLGLTSGRHKLMFFMKRPGALGVQAGVGGVVVVGAEKARPEDDGPAWRPMKTEPLPVPSSNEDDVDKSRFPAETADAVGRKPPDGPEAQCDPNLAPPDVAPATDQTNAKLEAAGEAVWAPRRPQEPSRDAGDDDGDLAHVIRLSREEPGSCGHSQTSRLRLSEQLKKDYSSPLPLTGISAADSGN